VTKIATKAELITTLKDSNQRVINWFVEILATDFFTRQGEVWSASDNLRLLLEYSQGRGFGYFIGSLKS